MCLGEVAQVVELGAGPTALVRWGERLLTVSLLTLDEPLAPGDWVVAHSGFVLARLTPAEAAEATAIRADTTTTTAPATTPAPAVPSRKDPP